MKEFPVFVPFGREDHLAAVLAVPGSRPRGIAVLSTGLGAGRSHRFGVWALLAERLARVGVASIRFDYYGVHDSTGEFGALSLSQIPVDQMRTVARFAQRVLEVEPVVTAGNCLGAQAALSLAAEMDECVGAACLLPRITEPGRLTVLLQNVVGGRLVAFVRRRQGLRRIARALARRDLKTRSYLLDSVSRAVDHGRVLFLVDEPFRVRMHRPTKLQEALDTVPEDRRDRFELRVLQGVDLDRFGSLETHRVVLDSLVQWIDQRMEEHDQVTRTTRLPSPTVVSSAHS
jgi:pimeloyl-ACP methyl ester carboxylesterase